jgi:PAS domain S-box-containing protein
MVVGLEGTDAGGAYLCQAENGELELVAHSGLSPSFIEKVSRVQADTIQARLVQAGRPVYEAQQLLSPEFLKFRQSEGLRGLTILPLQHEGRVIAAICLVSHIHDSVPPQTRIVLETVAAQAAGAIARIRAEDALRQSEARLRATINSAPIVLFAVNSQGTITFEDGQALRIPGFESGANVGKSVFEVFASLPQVLENVQRALRGEEFNALLDVAGHFLDCWYLPNRDKNGNCSGFTGVATNITDRLRLERQILEISDREQARIGQDIHDGLCQQLVSLAFDANSLMHELSAAGHAAADKAKKIADLLDQSITEARQVSRGLFPARLELDGLPSALDDLAQIINERFQIACLFEGAGEVEIPTAEAATHLYRIAQEAVNNAVKHSQARTILIRLRREPEQIELRVEDDGNGLSETENGDHSGMGLHIMDYRARSIGAALRIASRPEGGTIVCCKLPEAN